MKGRVEPRRRAHCRGRQEGRRQAERRVRKGAGQTGGEHLAYSLLKRPPEVDCHRRGF